MANPHCKQISIHPEVQPILERLSKSGKTEKRYAERASLVLLIDAGGSDKGLAKQTGKNSKTVKKWRFRWLDFEADFPAILEQTDKSSRQIHKELSQKVLDALSDKARPGVAMKFTAAQYCALLSVSLETPAQSGRPIDRWTTWELADEVAKRGIFKSISPTQVGRFLKKKAT